MAKLLFSLLAGVIFCVGIAQAHSTTNSANDEVKPLFRGRPPDGL